MQLTHSARTLSARDNQQIQIWELCPSASLLSYGRPQIWKYVEGKKKKEEERIMPSLVATTSALCLHQNSNFKEEGVTYQILTF